MFWPAPAGAVESSVHTVYVGLLCGLLLYTNHLKLVSPACFYTWGAEFVLALNAGTIYVEKCLDMMP
jgi:hypothetical protein